MSRDTKWCQNPKCPEKKNSNQIRGVKGNKYYQSNKANGYGNDNFCTLGCQTEWDNIYMDRAIDSMGVRINDPVKVNLEDAWLVESDYQYNRGNDTRGRYVYFLINKLFNVRHSISVEQATNGRTPPENHYSHWRATLTSAQAKELAKQLGLTNQ